MAPGREAPHDVGGGLDLLQRHRLAPHLLRALHVEEAAQGHQLLGLVVDLARERAVLVGQVAAHRMLQVGHHRRPPHVRLAADAIGILAADVERVLEHRHVAEGLAMPLGRLARDLAQADAFDLRVRAGEVLLHEGRAQADRIEDLRAAIGLIGRDAHLGHDLQDALVDRLDVALLRFLVGELLVELGQQLLQRLEGQIRIDRLRAVARQHGELMHLVRLAGLHHQADGRAQALLDQVMVHGRGGEQRRDRNPIRAGRAVRQDDDVVLLRAHGLLGLGAHHVERVGHAARALLDRDR